MGPMEKTTQALNLQQTSVQGLKPEGHHPRFESWPMALKIPVGPRPGSYRDYTFFHNGSASDSYGDYDSPPRKLYSGPDADGPPKKNPDEEKKGVLNALLGGPVKLLGLDGSGGGLLGNLLSSGH
ncbi:hypothetical protein PGT21_033025 [Puccinia graminis f. sp. tritici]|uniref:Uncharacterized protein n=1 Tax=Puccinia graminis f. sp. tritici TaxID=56615 RepID=A0A5B0MF48_PUCGR|nr:hypothetical protein PGT21_033025 [Puccinia graminis f. sp. tritici]